VATDELVDAVERRVAEVKELRTRIRDLERQAAAGRSGELADLAIDGIVIERVDGLDRDGVRDLAVAIRDRAGIKAVVLGTAPEGGGVTIVAAVAADSGLNASELISDAATKVKGGGGKSADLAGAGGKDPEALDEALDLVRAAVRS
ncbi:MAG: alanine--tRNA ligase, partial [Acidimicrobiia bacterium]|nr:alanine--tRNA ligase [Acidimicrobiia bacterium]